MNQCIAMQLFSHEFLHSEYCVQSEAVVLSMQSSTQAAAPARLVVEVRPFRALLINVGRGRYMLAALLA